MKPIYLRPSVHILLFLAASFFANLSVVTSLQWVLGDLVFLPISRQHYVNTIASDPLFSFLLNWAPFIASFGSDIIYLLPLRSLYTNRSTEEQKQKALRRMLNAPIIVGLIQSLGWVYSLSTLFIVYLAIGIPIDIYEGLNNVGAYSAFGIMTFVLSFYSADIINRRLYIPNFLPDGIPERLQGAISISLRFRLEVFVFSAAIAPTLILTLATINLHSQSKSSIPSYVLYCLGLVFIVMSFVLGALLARFMQKPIVMMQKAVSRIRNLDFHVKMPILSSDEIGTLTQGINEMAASLAEKEKIKETFGRAVDPRVRDHMLSGKIDAAGESLDVTVLFCDIRNFTKFSERRTPEQVVSWLNAYFEEMAIAIDAHGGVINKYIGDAIMAVFNAPIPIEAHALKAVNAGQEMLRRLEELNERTSFDDDKIRIGIGIATGNVLAGNIGSSARIEYTVIGDTVNTASRAESLCKKFGLPILFTDSVIAAIKEQTGNIPANIRKAGQARVKGKENMLEIYTVRGAGLSGSIRY